MEKKGLRLALIAASLCLASSFPALADSRIGSVSLRVVSDIEVGDDVSNVDISANSGKYTVEDVEVTNEPDGGWDDRDRPKVRVTVAAGDGYYFPSDFSKGDVELSGDDADVSSISRDRDEIRVNLTLARLDEDDAGDEYDLDVYDLDWDSDYGEASWNSDGDAKKFEVRVYRNGESVSDIKTTSDTDYNFSSYFTRSGDYTFRVRGIYNSSNKGDWEESEVLSVSAGEARDIRDNGEYYDSSDDGPGSSATNSGGPGVSAASGAWLRDSTGWWYCRADRSYPINQWMLINNVWYYFNAAGYMMTGWIQVNGVWYYCDPTSGAMLTGWIQTNGVWYYCDRSSGGMLTNTVTPDGYRVGADGAWIQ